MTLPAAAAVVVAAVSAADDHLIQLGVHWIVMKRRGRRTHWSFVVAGTRMLALIAVPTIVELDD